MGGDVTVRSPEPTCLHFYGNPLTTCPRAQEVCLLRHGPSPLRGVRSASGICPPALSGCTSSNERGPPPEFAAAGIALCPRCQGLSLLRGVRSASRLVSCPPRLELTPQRSQVRPRAVLCLFIREGFVSPIIRRTPCRRLCAGVAFQARLAHLWCLSRPVVLACTGLPPRLLSRDTLGVCHCRRSRCS